MITKPPMSVQVMIYPPSSMSVTGSEFVVSGAGICTTKYTLNLPINVRKEPGQTEPAGSADIPVKAPGFSGEFAIIGILLVTLLIKRRR